MTIFLTSSPTGPLDGSRIVQGFDKKNRFMENLAVRWKPDARCLMITAAPNAFDQNDEMTEYFKNALKQSSLPCQTFDLWDNRVPSFSSKSLDSYDVVFLGGGHVPTQNAFFQAIGLRDILRNYTGMIIGISAGSMNAAGTVYAQPELEGESVDPAYSRFLPGLELTDINLLPHYQMVKNSFLDGRRLFEDITYSDSVGRQFLAIPDGSYLLIENGRTVLWGEGYRIAEGQLTQISADNETILI